MTIPIKVALTDVYVKHHTQHLATWGVVLIGVIAGHIEQARLYLEMASYAVAIAAGLFNCWSIWRHRKDKKLPKG
jgi:ABC-type nickel/cobalt efflux system permease component RcnA